MDRRHFLALLSLPAFAALAQACGSDESSEPTSTGPNTDPNTGPTTPTGPTDPPSTGAPTTGEARSSLARVAAPASDASTASGAFDEFGRDVYRALAAAQPDGNLVFSPTSVAVALAMTSAGAKGPTLDEMLATLHVEEPDAIHRSVNALTAELDARNRGDVELSIANSLWGQAGLGFEQPFLDLLATEYGAGLNLVDYRADPEQARALINAWVEDETRGRIPELLGRGTITEAARLTLVNAIYMKAKWLDQFNEEATSDIAFTLADGTTKQVPAMASSRSLPCVVEDGVTAVELPYEGEELAMTLLVPDEGRMAELEQETDLAALFARLAPREVVLTLPKFDIESSLSVGDTLQALGMELAFTEDADFSGMTTEDSFKIGAVIHQANITIDEFGTEAAAATAVIMETTAAPVEDPLELVIDRPFLFAVRDRPTGAVLFFGRVGDPTS